MGQELGPALQTSQDLQKILGDRPTSATCRRLYGGILADYAKSAINHVSEPRTGQGPPPSEIRQSAGNSGRPGVLPKKTGPLQRNMGPFQMTDIR